MVFRLACALLPFLIGASDKEDIVRIDCDSGHVDPSLAGSSSITDSECVQSCQAACVNINVESDLEACLSNNDLDACLFQLSRVHEVDTNWCLAPAAEGAPTLVFSVDADDLMAIGDGKDVEAVSMIAELIDPSNVQRCANHGIGLGVSSQANAAESADCRWAGTASFMQTYSIQDRYLITNITELFSAAYQSKRALTIFGNLLDASCGAPALKGIDVAFSMKYKDGFRPSPACMEQANCYDCEAKGCIWCDWSETVEKLLPSWLPDWEWIDDARTEGRGMCGINSAICGLTAGRVNACAATSRTPIFLIVTSLTLALTFL